MLLLRIHIVYNSLKISFHFISYFLNYSLYKCEHLEVLSIWLQDVYMFTNLQLDKNNVPPVPLFKWYERILEFCYRLSDVSVLDLSPRVTVWFSAPTN